MKCQCGGRLKKIRTGTYQCLVCGKYSAVAFATLALPELTPKINDDGFTDLQIKVANEIANAFRIQSKYLKR